MTTKHKSPQKRSKQDEGRQIRNHSYKSRVASAIKDVIESVTAGDKAKAVAEMKKAQSIIDAAATKGILKRNTVARRVSRIMRRVARMA